MLDRAIRFMKPLFTLCLLWVCLCVISVSSSYASSRAQSIPVTGARDGYPSKFDQRFASMLRAWRVPGATVAIMKNGKILMARGYGWSDMSSGQAMQPYSLFRIASVSKTLTAVAILKLVEQNKLRLDDKVFNILNDLAPLNGRGISPRLYEITVRDLLQMSSGWNTDGPGSFDPMFGPWSSRMINTLSGKIPPSCVQGTRLMMGIPLRYRPGTTFSYSNLNYCLLGMIINKVNNQPYGAAGYQTYVQQNVLLPSGIQDMQIGRTQLYNRLPGEVKYYAYQPSNQTNVSGLPYSDTDILAKNYSDGGWIGSAPDLANYLQALNSGRILSPRMLSVMLEKPSFQKKPSNYFAMGWTVKTVNGHRIWSKHGSFTGTIAQVIQRDDGTSYVALFNMQPGSKVQFLNQVQRVLLSYAPGQ